MYCQNCGEKLSDDAKFCGNCGTPVNGSKNSSKNSAPINFDGVLGNSIDVVKSGANDFKNEWDTWSSKKKFLSIIVCCCIGWIVLSGVMGVLTPDKNADLKNSDLFDETNLGKNISIIKEYTGGYAYYSGNKTVYNYGLSGVLKNIPMDSDGFTVHGTFYDGNGKVIKEKNSDLDYFSYYTEKSNPTTIMDIQTYEFVNVSKIQITIMNPGGDVVFDETFDFDMDKFDLSRLDDKPTLEDTNSTDDSNKNSSSSDDDWDTSVSSTGRRRIEQIMDDSSSSSSSSSGVVYVGSVNSDKFHYPSCTHAKRIKDGNKITFSSRDEAISRGYSPCGVCTP